MDKSDFIRALVSNWTKEDLLTFIEGHTKYDNESFKDLCVTVFELLATYPDEELSEMIRTLNLNYCKKPNYKQDLRNSFTD